MRGSDMRTGELFSYVNLEERVPRLIRGIVSAVLATFRPRICGYLGGRGTTIDRAGEVAESRTISRWRATNGSVAYLTFLRGA
jgi:hypothetical protein